MKKYLDTSSLRTMGSGLVAMVGVEESYCSALAFIELLNGLRASDQEFSRRASCIRALLASGIPVDWTLPIGKIVGAFDACKMEEERVNSLQQIVRAVAAASDLQDFTERLEQLDARFPIEYFEQYDEEFDRDWIQAGQRGNLEIRQAFEQLKANPVDDGVFPPEVMAGSYRDFCLFFVNERPQLSLSLTVMGLAGAVARWCHDVPTEAQENEIYQSYNRSIEIFVRAYTLSDMLGWSEMAIPAKNDGTDLAHLLYLGKEDGLVSQDRKLVELATAVGVPVFKASR